LGLAFKAERKKGPAVANYKNTMNLPVTDFPMRANLPQNEPKRLDFWNDIDIYAKVLEKNKYTIPDGSEREIIIAKKLSQTSAKYPRAFAQISKKPL
jgi:hypothetical protein